MPQQKAREWHQAVVIVNIFFITTHLQFKKKKKEEEKKEKSFSLTNVFEKAVKIINFIKSWPFRACLFNLWDKMGRIPKMLLLHTEVQWLSWGKAVCDCLSCKLNYLFFCGALFLLERTSDKQTMVIQTWVFDSHFLENKWSEPVTWRQTTWQYLLTMIKLQLSSEN